MRQSAGWTLVFLFTLAMSTGVSEAQSDREPINVAELGPQVGDEIPDFTLPDQNGKTWSRDSLMGENGALILFHRSADW